MEKLLVIVCPGCGEPDLVPFAANGLVGKCNVCGGTFVIQGEIVPLGFCCALDPATASRPVAVERESASEDHGASASESAIASTESAPAPQPAAALNRAEQPLRNPKRTAALYVGIAASILVVLIVGRQMIEPRDSAMPRESAPASNLHLTLSNSDNGYMWNRADYASRIALCETFARNNPSKPGERVRDAKWFYDAIHSFYNTNPQAPILQLDISQPAKLAVLQDKTK